MFVSAILLLCSGHHYHHLEQLSGNVTKVYNSNLPPVTCVRDNLSLKNVMTDFTLKCKEKIQLTEIIHEITLGEIKNVCSYW